MPFFPLINNIYQQKKVVDTFMGFNKNLKIDEREFHATTNLTSDYFPMLANRRKRGILAEVDTPLGIIAKSQLAVISGGRLLYGDVDITHYFNDKGLSIDPTKAPKQMVSMGAYIVIFPDKLYINTTNFTDCGSIDTSFTSASGTGVACDICNIEGVLYSYWSQATPPDNPSNGTMWVDTSNPDSTKHVLKEYDEVSGSFVEVPTVYTKIRSPGIGAGFSQFDGVTISGLTAAGTALETQVNLLNGEKIIYACDTNSIVIIGMLSDEFYQTTSVTISRKMPDLDFVTEANNRLWGCKYGLVNGQTVNSIYCCALGDFKNWSQFLGIASDSWFANVGTDGPWTGAITHLGFPIFFKENVLHKIYISDSGAHRVVDTACRGVQSGSDRSLVVVNEHLFYKAVSDICMYDGSLPVSVSDNFGTDNRWSNAAAGSLKDKYYISMQNSDGEWSMFVYDTAKGMWHREDDTHATQFARLGDELYYFDVGHSEPMILTVNGSELEYERSVPWAVESGTIGYRDVEQKYVSRINIRMLLPPPSYADMYIEYDDYGGWEHIGHIDGTGLNTFMLPLRPRRCDHFRFKLEGEGEIRIYSIATVYEVGSDET